MKFRKEILVILGLSLMMTACGGKEQPKVEKVSEKTVQTTPKKKVFLKKETKYKTDETTEVLVDKEIKKEDIVSFYQHGDHWHVFTKDGREHITYKDPEKIQANEKIDVVNVVEKNELQKISVVSIKKHGDHWHVYTSDGKEFLTYSDPSSLYPNIPIGIYEGNHGGFISSNQVNPATRPETSSSHHSSTTKVEAPSLFPQAPKNINIIGVLGKADVDRNDIIRILKHGDHYHLYDSKGNEGITYEDPRALYPKAKFGDYIGSHDHNPQKEKEFEWPKDITRIIDHKDHWHLYRGDKEVAIVQINPKAQYPNAEWIEEEGENTNIIINDDQVFSYDSVEPKMIEGLLPYLSNNLKSMEAYGSLKTDIPIFGSNKEVNNIFYWLHNDHYHAITIKQIIQKAENKEFGPYSAKDVVAVLKYKILNPGTSLEPKITVSFEEVQAFLMKHYKIKNKSDVMQLYSNVEIYKNGENISISLQHFEKKDGEIISKIELPQFKKDSDSLEEKELVEEEKDEHDNTSEVSENNEDQLTKEKENLEKIAKYLGIDTEEAFDVIYEVIDDVSSFRIADLTVDDQGNVTLNGKVYKLR